MPIHLQPAFAYLGLAAGSMPVSESVSERVLSLPIHAYMSTGDIHCVSSALRAAVLDRKGGCTVSTQ
jgi:dTDP-4-amino-4,6-dideoxygalactose transaminase